MKTSNILKGPLFFYRGGPATPQGKILVRTLHELTLRFKISRLFCLFCIVGVLCLSSLIPSPAHWEGQTSLVRNVAQCKSTCNCITNNLLFSYTTCMLLQYALSISLSEIDWSRINLHRVLGQALFDELPVCRILP